MTNQHTIASPVTVSGIGLHTGVQVNVRLMPGKAKSGIIFKRTDLDGFIIEARSRQVAHVSYATSLMKKGVLISTTEHLLSALAGSGVDNAVVELDNLELPILDGSALPFFRLIAKAGFRRQRARRSYVKVLKPVEIVDGQKRIAVYPSDAFRVTYHIEFQHPLIGEQSLDFVPAASSFTPPFSSIPAPLSSMPVPSSSSPLPSSSSPLPSSSFPRTRESTGDYERDIAPARTFGFLEEVEMLRQSGLVKGGSLENAIVLSHDGILNPEGLRFPDEFCRHKILDLIGDLALLGHPLIGHVEAEKAGHSMHVGLVERLLREKDAWELVHADDRLGPGYDSRPADLAVSSAT